MFNRSAFENSRPAGIPTLEITTTGPFPEAGVRRFIPLQKTVLEGEIAGPLASLTLTQVFAFTKEDLPRPVEAVYRFPLPGDAAVIQVCVTFGEVRIEAALRERPEAEAEYDRARGEGRQAALATRESPDVFTLQVAGIAPGQEVRVETRFVLLAHPEGDGWSLRVPLTAAPRYVRADELGSRHAEGQPLALLRDPGHRFGLNLSLRHTEGIASRTHRLTFTPDEDATRVALADGEVIPDRDFVLTWTGTREETRPTLRVELHPDPAEDRLYFMGLVTPPRRADQVTPDPREILILVDHSGSMSGAKWEAADWAVKSFLSTLTERDRFNLGLFHDKTRWYSRSPVPATPQQVEAAVEFLMKHRDSGGTELGVALEQSLKQSRSEDPAARHVLIVTDAQVSDSARLLRLVSAEANRPDRRRVSVICIDASPNSLLVRELAARGGGQTHFLTSSAEEGDITTALDELLISWSAPIFTGLRLEVDATAVETPEGPGHETGNGSTCIDLGELPAERPVWVAGRAPASRLDQLRLRLSADGQPVATCRMPIGSRSLPAVKTLFGARRVLALEYLAEARYSAPELAAELRRLGYSEAEIGGESDAGSLYSENRGAAGRDALRPLLVREALACGIASAETAFVATRAEAGEPISGTVYVANALPEGWSDDFVGGAMYGAAFAAAPPSALAGPPLASSSRSIDAMSGAFDLGGSGVFERVGRIKYKKVAEPQSEEEPLLLFAGCPHFQAGEAVLYDSEAENSPRIGSRLQRLWLRLLTAPAEPQQVPRDLMLLVYVGDHSVPRAKVAVRALLSQGARPLNLTVRPGEQVRLVLVDPSAAWGGCPPKIEVRIQ